MQKLGKIWEKLKSVARELDRLLSYLINMSVLIEVFFYLAFCLGCYFVVVLPLTGPFFVEWAFLTLDICIDIINFFPPEYYRYGVFFAYFLVRLPQILLAIFLGSWLFIFIFVIMQRNNAK